jgi:hypothetical protein
MLKKTTLAIVAAIGIAGSIGIVGHAAADNTLVKFDGGIGVIPVSAGVGMGATATDVTRNIVRNVQPPGQPWVIRDLTADIKVDGSIRVKGEGLLLAGGNGIGTTGNQSVRATLICDTTLFDTNLVLLEPNGDFRIDDVLSPAPPTVCANPVLLIRNAGGAWFAAGIPDLSND